MRGVTECKDLSLEVSREGSKLKRVRLQGQNDSKEGGTPAFPLCFKCPNMLQRREFSILDATVYMGSFMEKLVLEG